VDAGNLSGLLTSLLNTCISFPLAISEADGVPLRSISSGLARGTTRAPFALILEYQKFSGDVARKTGVAIAEASSGNSATHMLKRILAGLQTPGLVDSALLIVDERSPLTLAAVGQERLKELQAMGSRFSVYTLSFKEYTALDGLISVVGLASAGDLTVVGFDGNHTSVSEAEVYQSHYRTGRYLTSGLLNQLTGLRLLASSVDVA
jgi:hypothetical protein